MILRLSPKLASANCWLIGSGVPGRDLGAVMFAAGSPHRQHVDLFFGDLELPLWKRSTV